MRKFKTVDLVICEGEQNVQILPTPDFDGLLIRFRENGKVADEGNLTFQEVNWLIEELQSLLREYTDRPMQAKPTSFDPHIIIR